MPSSTGAVSASCGFRSRCHVFVDESKSAGYIAAATYIEADKVAAVRRTVASLRLSGAERLHFVHERDARRKQILEQLLMIGIRARVYVARTTNQPLGRRETLTALVHDALRADVQRIVLEQDDSVLAADRRLLTPLVRLANRQAQFEHARSKSEPLLWPSDAIAWCWQRGGPWIARSRPLIDTVRVVL
jgi:hypothetical protein